MARVRILTDSSAQFSVPSFPGQELVSILPYHIQFNGNTYSNGKNLKLLDLPPSSFGGSFPLILPPSVAEFRQVYNSLGQESNEILTILISTHLSPAIAHAQEAAANTIGHLSLPLVDSKTTGIGLGMLVQAAAEAANEGARGEDLKRLILGLLGHVYTIFCVQSLTYLSHASHLDASQAIVGEMLGVSPLLMLENGKLVPIQKIRSLRHLVDLLHEFISEFGQLKHISLIKGTLDFDQEARNLRERLAVDFPNTPFTEHSLNTALACLIGPRSLGLVAIEEPG